MSDPRDDAQLVTAYRAGDRAALAALYDRFAPSLYDTAAAMLSDRHEAADVVQDTFLVAAERMGQLREPERIKPWLFAIARHEIYRRTKRRGRVTPSEVLPDVAAPVDPHAEGELVSYEQLAVLVRDAARGLDERDQLVLELSVRRGLQGAELASALGVTPEQSYTLVHRMRERVERALGALVVARQGRRDCQELQQLLTGWDGTFSVLWRKRVARHVDACDICEHTRKAFAPLALFGAAPAFALPSGLRDAVLARAGQPGSAPRRPYRFAGDGGFPAAVTAGRRAAAIFGAAAIVVVAMVGALLFSLRGGEDTAVEGATGTVEATEPTSQGGGPTTSGPVDSAGDPTVSSPVVGAGSATTAPATTQPSSTAPHPTRPPVTPPQAAPIPTSTVLAGPPVATTDPPATEPSSTAPATTEPATTEPPSTRRPTGTTRRPPEPTAPPPPPTTAPPSPTATTTAATTTTPAPTTTQPPPGSLTLSATSINLGASATAATLQLQNTGGQPLAWSRGGASPFAVSGPSGGQLAPGATVALVITIDRGPLREGDISAILDVAGDDSASVRITASVEHIPNVAVLRVVGPAFECTQSMVSVLVSVTDESAVARVSGAWKGAGGTGTFTLAPNGNGQWSGTIVRPNGFGPGSAGSHAVTISATDARGNSGSASAIFVVEPC
jgi:RNA polymerase sigma factor (sigma-70 family)